MANEPNQRANVYLSLLLGIGVLLEVTFFHAAYHADTVYGKSVEGLYLGYLVASPFIVWRIKGDRLLRIANILFWGVCVGVLLFGGYLLAYHDL